MTEAAAVLFDLDGTLTNSAAGIQRSTREGCGCSTPKMAAAADPARV